MLSVSRETKNFFGLVLFGATYGAALDYAHTHGGAIEYPEGTHHERGILTFAAVYSVMPKLVSMTRMRLEEFIEIDPLPATSTTATTGGATITAGVSATATGTTPVKGKKASPADKDGAPATGAAGETEGSVGTSPDKKSSRAPASGSTVTSTVNAADSHTVLSLPSVAKAFAAYMQKSATTTKKTTAASTTSTTTGTGMYVLAVKGLQKTIINFTSDENARRRFKRRHPLCPWPIAFSATAVLYTCGYLLTAYGWNRVPSVVIAALLATPTMTMYYKWDRSVTGLISMALTGLCGACGEAFLNTYVESMTYQTNDILGIPYWLFWVYALCFSTYGHITNFLLEPMHHKKVFVGVENLPHKWARNYYRNHLGLPKDTKPTHEY